jgi:hypothetical protein
MPVESVFANAECTLVEVRIRGQWTWEELVAGVQQLVFLIKSVPHPVDVIADLRGSTPPEMNFLNRLPEIGKFYAENQRLTVVVGLPPGILVAVAQLYSRVYRPLHLVQTMEQAHRLIADHDHQPAA